jgi:hypothetical protein
MLPRTLIKDMESADIPEGPRKAIRTAIQHYDRGNYHDAAVRCRVTIETAFAEQGISRDHLSRMTEKARNESLITEGVRCLCVVVAHFGGKAAHPQSDPAVEVTRSDSLTLIAVTANVLRHLYLSANAA